MNNSLLDHSAAHCHLFEASVTWISFIIVVTLIFLIVIFSDCPVFVSAHRWTGVTLSEVIRLWQVRAELVRVHC